MIYAHLFTDASLVSAQVNCNASSKSAKSPTAHESQNWRLLGEDFLTPQETFMAYTNPFDPRL